MVLNFEKHGIKFAGDFETTVYNGQTDTEVWASAVCELENEDPEKVLVFHSIEETYNFLLGLQNDVLIYYHNLKFDGCFWVDFLLRQPKMKQAFEYNEIGTPVTDIPEKKMPKSSFNYCISDRGQWYFIKIKTAKGKIIEVRDSLKLIPMSIDAIGKNFGTKHQKKNMVYDGFRYAGCEIALEEEAYIKNDVLVLAEALNVMWKKGNTSLTIGSCCLAEYRKEYGKSEIFKDFFPSLSKEKIDPALMGESEDRLLADFPTMDEYIRKSYHGGWCYVAEGKEKRVYDHGYTYDVNSLYPSVMHSMSGSRYPVGKPIFWKASNFPDGFDPRAKGEDVYYIVHFKCRFKLKEGYLPFIQIKDDAHYQPTEMLKTSDFKVGDRYYKGARSADGKIIEARPELWMTCTDWVLFNEHYEIYDLEILDGCFFRTEIGLFDSYINTYMSMKIEATKNGNAAWRQIAKLFLNNLYGKFATSSEAGFKYAEIDKETDKAIYMPISRKDLDRPLYIPIGTAITSYARNFTIRAAQKNYHGPDAPGFIYADTDSIHADLTPDEIKGMALDDSAFCCWKCEAEWNKGFFTRQKTYIERTEKGYTVKCAGMPESCKKVFIAGLTGDYNREDFSPEQLDYLEKENGEKIQHDITEFDIGLKIYGKLMTKHITGGVILYPDYYTMTKRIGL